MNKEQISKTRKATILAKVHLRVDWRFILPEVPG
ncbi:hypothetical protein FHW89_001708 [Mucilaginibacter sp. SG564]|nr:hypothetical protein [Mucilaginibacter sp. SG564]